MTSGSRGNIQAATAATDGVHRILRNSTFNLAGQASYAVFHLAVIAALARSLGPQGFGAYYTLFAIVLVVQLVVEGGAGTILVRRLTRNPEQASEILAEAATLFALIALLSAAALSVAGLAWDAARGGPPMWPAFAAAGVACAALQVQRLCVGALQARELFAYENLARVLQGALMAGLVVGLLDRAGPTVARAAAMLAASHVAAAAFLTFGLVRIQGGVLIRPRRPRFRAWIAEAAPLGFGDVVRGLTWQLDTVLLGLMQPAAVVGIYSMAYRPLGPLNWLPRAVLSASFPAFTRLADSDRDGLRHAVAESTRLLLVVSLPIAVAICVCAEPIVLLLAGPEFREAAVPLRFLIWIAVASYLSMQFRYLFSAVGRPRAFAALVGGVFLYELAVEAALIPWLGYFGALIGSVSGELLFVVTGFTLCRRLGIAGFEWKTLAGPVAAATVMGVLLWPARDAALPLLAAAVAGAGAAYLVLCLWLGGLRLAELKHFVDAWAGKFRGTRFGGRRVSPAVRSMSECVLDRRG